MSNESDEMITVECLGRPTNIYHPKTIFNPLVFLLHDPTTTFVVGRRSNLIPRLWIHRRACGLYFPLILFVLFGGRFGHFLGEHIIRWWSTGTFVAWWFEAFLLDSDTGGFAR